MDVEPSRGWCTKRTDVTEVAKRRDHSLYYNGHGDLAASADGSGTRTALHTYDPFGAPVDTQPANQTVHGFTGAFDKQTDAASGLTLMGARPYDPGLGRFLEVDPIDGGSANNYDYSGQDPINGSDLSGTMMSTLMNEGGVVPLSGEQIREQYAYDYFVGQGFTGAQAAGVVGNLSYESHHVPGPYMNPGATQNGCSSCGFGLAQWSGSRRSDLHDFASSSGSPMALESTQLLFISHELAGPEAGAGAALRSATTARGAAAVWEATYERAGVAALSKRQDMAASIYRNGGYSTVRR